MLTIAIDFDDTFTADETLWRSFARSAKDRGHRVMCVTFRRDNQENIDGIREAFGWHLPVVMTSGQQKRQFCVDHDIKVDIWIDDSPESIVGDKEALELAAAYDRIRELEAELKGGLSQ